MRRGESGEMPLLANPLAVVRSQLQQSLRTMIVGPGTTVRDLNTTRSDVGLFGPTSATWVVHADASMLIGGIRALLMQTLHPLAMAGIAQHSAYREDPIGRLHRTAGYVGTTTFGTTAEAKAAVRMVKKVHRRVVGTAADGRPYSANDPHLLGWVHHTLVESFYLAHQRYGASPLSSDDFDRYVDEQAIVAKLIGSEPVAHSVGQLEERMAQIRPELKATGQARNAVRFLLLPPLALQVLPAYGVLASAAVGLMPSWARRELRIARLPLTERFAVRPAAKILTQTLGWAMSAP